ncbi:phage tail protein [Pseudomonas lundensis]|uniref:Phage-related tail fiber protein n=1 Tax=Pseudomonas lundensis TaxID=86185 RepID=A0AAX2HC47_9PSED|nr:phage tail protein [Pseudomonas lundensis]SOB53769.1 putative Phage-related tail fiber protein [Pseudomonas lundensis]
MIDQNSQFMAILTAVGEAKQANADALGIPWTFSKMGVGDANGTDPIPNRLQTKLINERNRAPLNQVKVDPKNTNVIIAEQVIPENVGGWWIREIGLYDADGDLVAVANCAPSFKPLLAQGSGKTQVVRMNFIVTSAANVTLKIDPSVVLATRQYVDDSIAHSTTETNNALAKKVSRSGDEMTGGLVFSNGTNVSPALSWREPSGIGGFSLNNKVLRYIGYYGAESKQLFSLDFNSGHVANARGTLWDVVTYPPSNYWNTSNFNPATKADATAMVAALATKAEWATTLAGYRISDAYTKTQTGEAIANAIAELVDASPEALDTLNELAAALGNDPNFAATVNDELSKRVKRNGDAMTGALTLTGSTTSSPSLSFKSAEGTGSLNVYQQRLRYIGYYGSESKEVFSVDFATGDAFNGRRALWDVAKYPPGQFIKLNQSLASGTNLRCGSGNSPYIASMTRETGSLEVHNEANSAASAVILFHRRGAFGAYLGLDTDNQFKVGGLSMGANAHTLWHSGNAPKNTGSMGYTGWWRCADTGRMRMWGVTGTVGQDVAVTVALPMTFPNAIFGVNFIQIAEMKASATGNYSVKDVTRSSFTIVNGNDGVGPCYWEAWGN